MSIPSAYSQEKIGNREAVTLFDHHVILTCLAASYGLSDKELEESTAKTRIAFTGTQSLSEFYRKYDATRSSWAPVVEKLAREKGFRTTADYALDTCNNMRKQRGLPPIPAR